ncbi:hypothetical protein DB347_19520 [Opitutaceae bacterium EW11]|nr:hypothetical protein DB347_19520 [Opitutaceae bacterium EW11]
MISIRRRLAIALCVALGALLFLGMGVLHAALRHALLRQFDEALVARLRDVESDLRRGVDPASVAPQYDHHGHRGQRDYFVAYGPDGRVVASDGGVDLGRLDAPETRRGPGGVRFWNMTLPDGRPARAGELPIRSPASGVSRVVVVVDRIGLEHALGATLLAVTIVGVALLTVTVTVVLWMLKRGLRPLDALSVEAEKIDATTLDHRFNVAVLPKELRPIGTRLNDLLARLQSSFTRERRVSADLAHELRTPLAELRVLAESALKWPDARDPQTDREVLAAAAHMEALIERMLLLARSEGSKLVLAQETVDVSSLLGSVWRTFSARAAERGLASRIELPPASVETDPVLLRSIVSNLVENAVDYAPATGLVAISCREEGENSAVIEVSNTTTDLKQEDLSRLFERYWRKEAARSSSGHFGLGLSLVRGFCDLLGWSITARLDKDGRLIMTLRGLGRGAASPRSSG